MHELESEFWKYFFDDNDTNDSIRATIDRLMRPADHTCSETLKDSGLDAPLSCLTDNQHDIAAQIIDSGLAKTDHVLFLHRSAGTGKLFQVKAAISEQTRRVRVPDWGTTGIVGVQYQGGIRDIHFASSELTRPRRFFVPTLDAIHFKLGTVCPRT
jgi:hypothetical protein